MIMMRMDIQHARMTAMTITLTYTQELRSSATM